MRWPSAAGATCTRTWAPAARRWRVSYILGLGDIEASLAEAERIVAQGVRVLKVKVGQNWGADLQRLQRLR